MVILDANDSPTPSLAKVRMLWGVQIPTRDGLRLNATLYLPKELAAPAPTIFTLTPYIGQTYHDQGLYFAARGFPFLTVDVRGRGNSEGVFQPLVHEWSDGYDIVEWLALQPYCNGRVTMWGGSYAGFAQWAAAKEMPPHLATIVPVASPYLAVDFPIRSNIAESYWMQWLTLVWGRTSQDRMFWSNEAFWGEKFRQWLESGAAFKQLDTQLGCPSEIFQEWVAHPQQDDYWDSYNPTADQYAKINFPVLTITGSYDGDQLGALEHYRQHLSHAPGAAHTHYLVIGPWDHAGTRTPQAKFCGLEFGQESLVDLGALHLQWYRWTLQDGPRPAFLQKNVAYYVMGAEKWRYVDSLEHVTARVQTLYLHSNRNPVDVFHSGSLQDHPESSGPDHYIYEPRDVSLAALESTTDPENRADQRMVLAAVGKQLVYHSTPFAEDTEISGLFRLSLWLAIDQPDTDFRATIYEITIEGKSIQLTTDAIRARYRESLRQQKLIDSLEPLKYDFERFMFVSRLIRRGHRLRLVIGPINSVYSQKNYNSGGVVSEESMEDARVVTARLFHDRVRLSALSVPIGRGED